MLVWCEHGPQLGAHPCGRRGIHAGPRALGSVTQVLHQESLGCSTECLAGHFVVGYYNLDDKQFNQTAVRPSVDGTC